MTGNMLANSDGKIFTFLVSFHMYEHHNAACIQLFNIVNSVPSAGA